MYVPKPYQEHRQDVLLDAIRARSFGTLISENDGRIELTHIPFAVTEIEGRVHLVAHLARANGHWRTIDESREVVVSFLVDDGYISPSWYPSKAETGKVVPTWNYVAIEARGRPRIIDDACGLLRLVELLTDRHESERSAPWSTDDAPTEFTAALLNHIVGIEIGIETLTGAWKLDQKKKAPDRRGASTGLSHEPRGKSLSMLMSASG